MRHDQQLSNAVRQLVKQAMADMALPQIYTITSYDGNGAVKVNVNIDPTTPPVESNWMPLGGIGVGNGYGLFVAPQVGDQVLVVFENGDVSGGVVVARLFSNKARPMAVPAGETWMVHQTGSLLKLTSDGKVTVADKAGSSAALDGTGKVIITAATEIDMVGGGGTAKGIVQADCVCPYTGQPHSMVSATVKGTV